MCSRKSSAFAAGRRFEFRAGALRVNIDKRRYRRKMLEPPPDAPEAA